MKDREGFLSRWSRRKREAEDAAPESAAPAPPRSDEAVRKPDTDSCENESPTDDIDNRVAALPSIESITESTDVRAFLDPGIPAQLTRAALRRAWVADPAIRDFVGLSENAWDFNAPDAVPGFGSVLPSEQAQRMIAGMLDGNEPARPSEGSCEALEKPDISAPQDSAPAVSENEQPAGPAAISSAVADQSDSNVAPQDENRPDHSETKLALRHGRALPR